MARDKPGTVAHRLLRASSAWPSAPHSADCSPTNSADATSSRITLLIYGLATGASALSLSVAVLIALRFVVGLGLGAELPVASTLVSEFAPPRIRGRIIVILESFWAVGWTLAAVIGYLVVPASADGWRWALLIGAAPALYAVFVRLRLPESVRFLESRGRHDEAELTVRRFEASAGLPAATGAITTGKTAAVRTRVAELWAPALRRRTAALWLVWFCVNFSYYGAFIWLPTILVASGFSLVRSFGFTLIITLAQLPGYAASAYLIEKWGRRQTLAVFLSAPRSRPRCSVWPRMSRRSSSPGMLLSFFNLGAWGALYAVTPELYPTRMRATGAGWAAGVGRIASILAPLAVPFLRDGGRDGVPVRHLRRVLRGRRGRGVRAPGDARPGAGGLTPASATPSHFLTPLTPVLTPFQGNSVDDRPGCLSAGAARTDFP